RHPRDDRVAVLGLGGTEHLEQDAAHVGVANPGGGVGVPAERGTTRTAPGLVLGPVGAGRRIVGLLGLPGDDAVLDVDLPAARAGAVHAVGRAHHLVVGPAVPVEAVTLATAVEVQRAMVLRDLPPGEETPGADQGL